MTTCRFVYQAAACLLVGLISGCTTVDRLSARGDAPYFMVNSSDSKALQILSQKQDRLLKGCTKPSPLCDQLLYARALAALFESRARATTLFQQSVQSMPTAGVGAQWLALLQLDSSISEPSRALLSQYVTRELLEHGTPSDQLRLKAQEKRIEELTKQLDLLKQIDQDRRLHDLRSPRTSGTVSPE
jgi:hypothetical protein